MTTTDRHVTGVARVMTTLILTLGTIAAASAQHHQHPPTVGGKWTLTVEAGPHGATTMAMALEQEGKTVTGSFTSPHGELALAGEFADSTLTLATKSADGPQITFKAKLKENGTLAGYLSSEMGDMTWTAERVKDKK